MNRISTCFASLLLSCALTAQAQQYQLNSPDGKLIVNIEAGQTLNWAIAHDGTTVLLPSDIAMQCTEAEGKPIAFTFGKDVFQMFADGRRLYAKQLGHALLRKPNCFVFDDGVYAHIFFGGLIHQKTKIVAHGIIPS